jgi:ADP-heptose:LPS heptosyltransferase
MKALLTRFGGIGDCFPVMVAARNLTKRGYEVTVALRDDGGVVKQSAMFANIPDVNVLDLCEIGPWRSRVVKVPQGSISVQAIYKDYDLVVDFMGAIESNNTSPLVSMKPWDFWQRSRNSNFRNWYDLHLEWCNIDPTKVSDEDKRPFLSLTEEEVEAGKKVKGIHSHLILVHPFASSLARSWFHQAKALVIKLTEKYPQAKILFWNPQENRWDHVTKRGVYPVQKLCSNPLRDSMAIVGASDLVIAVDTGFGHVAEALGKKSLVLYSTVPAWTRNKYYKHQTHIDMGETNPEFYTFTLSLGDPLRVKEEYAKLTDRELKIEKLFNDKVSLEDVCRELNTNEQGAELELKTLLAKQQSWEHQQSKALTLITPEMVLEKVEGIING